ncbi:MAG: DDE-type integrase/transposase/recombinase [Oscillospiraceae bacterium]|nr:DDE-type integrase/transposase/recombinase [Oscillospiraceae bacterium]MCI1989718.1 DDE-type integrase/transposase/recombinase [Oscillospiraceae bacterium]MCI2034321.1 DDE-type integrase/transposase/recombinase [Oscillospiraceae bacterium]
MGKKEKSGVWEGKALPFRGARCIRTTFYPKMPGTEEKRCFRKYAVADPMCMANKPYINIRIYYKELLSSRCPITSGLRMLPISLLPTAKGMLYLCAAVDLCGKMALSYRIGNDMTASLVTDTIRDALQKEKVAGGLALHSDQGSQYTLQAYFGLGQEYHFRPSMSSPGCPYDNAAMENFFGTLKTMFAPDEIFLPRRSGTGSG